jgi:carbonic anhydrase
VQAALEDRSLGLSDEWLKHVRGVRDKHRDQLDTLEMPGRFDRLCELNVIEQVLNVAQTTILGDAWSREQRITIHGWIYAIGNGLLRDLGICITRPEEASQQCEAAVRNLASGVLEAECRV